MTKFEVLTQSAKLIGKPDQSVHEVRFFEIAVWVLCFVCVDSHSFEIRIPLCLFFWILDSLRKVLTNFGNFSQPDGPVGKSDPQVHLVQFSETTAWVVY